MRIVAARKLNVKAYAAAAGAVVVALLPWRIWLAAHGIEGDMPVAKGLNPGYLLDRIDRVGPAIAAINGQFADPERWLFILPLATLVVVASLVSGVGRRVAAFYLGCFLLVWAAFVWSYWISPHDLEWHLATSVDRVVSIPMLVCLAAVLHLSGLLLASPRLEAGADGTLLAVGVDANRRVLQFEGLAILFDRAVDPGAQPGVVALDRLREPMADT